MIFDWQEGRVYYSMVILDILYTVNLFSFLLSGCIKLTLGLPCKASYPYMYM